jgi:uncharacterized protein (TIGR02996 family)
VTTRDALLAAVIAAPDDDLPRLVYADYLDDVGGDANVARAEFVRAEVTAERLPADDPERERLETRAAKLFNRHGNMWNAYLPGVGTNVCRLRYRRGFPFSLTTTFRHFIERGNLLLNGAPICSLQLIDYHLSGTEQRAARWHNLSRITSLRLGPGLGLGGWYFVPAAENTFASYCQRFSAILAEQSLTAIERIDLSGNEIMDTFFTYGFSQYGSLAKLRCLRELILVDNSLTDAGASFLAAARGLDNLAVVDLRGNRVTAAGIAVLRSRFGTSVLV